MVDNLGNSIDRRVERLRKAEDAGAEWLAHQEERAKRKREREERLRRAKAARARKQEMRIKNRLGKFLEALKVAIQLKPTPVASRGHVGATLEAWKQAAVDLGYLRNPGTNIYGEPRSDYEAMRTLYRVRSSLVIRGWIDCEKEVSWPVWRSR
jgi:hypothetical protein